MTSSRSFVCSSSAANHRDHRDKPAIEVQNGDSKPTLMQAGMNVCVRDRRTHPTPHERIVQQRQQQQQKRCAHRPEYMSSE